MPTPAKPPEVIARVREMIAQGKSQREISEACGVSAGLVSQIRNGKYKERETPTAALPTVNEGIKVDGDNATMTGIRNKFIQTYEDAVREFKVDTNVWKVETWECTAWTTTINHKEDGAQQIQNWRVALKLKRIAPKNILDGINALYERMRKNTPTIKLPALKPARGETFLAVLCLFDAHFGKLCWAPETNNDYDLKIAEAVYSNAVDDLLADVYGRTIEHWLFPLGNDFYHIDGPKNMTTNGTPQDADGRYAKIIESGFAAVISAIEKMARIAPVSVVHVPGNHDQTASWHLARMIDLQFKSVPRVTVDWSPNPRKYFHWNKTLLGLTHGNEEKKQSLPSIMPVERPQEWADSTCREWLCGHEHRARQWQTQPVDTHEQTTIRALRSLAGTDAWHHRKGYLSSKAAEVYFYGKTRGYAGHSVVPARV